MKLIFAFVFCIFAWQVQGECPRTPSYHGVKGPIVTSEVECALECKSKRDCNGYLFKPIDEFNAGQNTYESNCILQTIWDKNFLTDEVLEPVTDYKSKICVALTDIDHTYSERYVPVPDIDVKANAEKYGFGKSLAFDKLNVKRYYKVMTAEETRPYYYSRHCAQEVGTMATPYDLEMSKQILEDLELDPEGMILPGVARWAFAPVTLTEIQEKIHIFDNGHRFGFGAPERKEGKTCDIFESSTEGNSKIYYTMTGKWRPSATFPQDHITKFGCEFQGSGNLVQELKATYEATTVSADDPITKAFDNDWLRTSERTLGGIFQTSTDRGNLLVITFPNEIGVQKVRILPYGGGGGTFLKNPRVLVSNVKPLVSEGKLGDPTKFKLCGHFSFSTQAPVASESVISIVCGKCMPFGKYLTLENGTNKKIVLAELGVVGIEKSRFFK